LRPSDQRILGADGGFKFGGAVVHGAKTRERPVRSCSARRGQLAAVVSRLAEVPQSQSGCWA
jgi:hypothetical protein